MDIAHAIQILTLIASIVAGISGIFNSYRSTRNGQRINDMRIQVHDVNLLVNGRMNELIETKTAVARVEGAATAIQATVIDPLIKKKESS